MNPILISKTAACAPVKNSMTKWIAVTFASTLLLAAMTTSCSTTKGFGRDLQKVGDKIETEADRTGGTR